MNPMDGQVRRDDADNNHGPMARQSDAMAWECGDCGWTVHQESLPPGRSLHDVLDAHGEKYCARPQAWPLD